VVSRAVATRSETRLAVRRSLRGGAGPFRLGALLVACAVASGGQAAAADAPADVVLVTLDTTRADELALYGGAVAMPRLEALAAGGVRWARALTPAPLTLPAHASILTGLDPIEHGVRDNGSARLPAAIPTLAESLRAAGYATGAVVASRVLDRRFGLGRGFDLYDDRMVAERVGEYGYAERRATEVVDAALAWARTIPPARPFLLWVHFFDPHAPYEGASGDERDRYRAEIASLDPQIGRLLDGLGRDRPRIVAVSGDHGEAFGEHGEREHGLLLHEATLAVPLVAAGPGVPSARVVTEAVSIAGLGPTLERLARVAQPRLPQTPLPFVTDAGGGRPVWHESALPASAWGWRELTAVTFRGERLVRGSRVELFDLAADPREGRDRSADRPDRARDLARRLRQLELRRARAKVESPGDPDLTTALGALGYLSGSRGEAATVDPRDAVGWIDEYRRARAAAAADRAGAAATMRGLVARSPASAPFRSFLAELLTDAGDLDGAREQLERNVAANPGNELARFDLARLELRAGRTAAAERELRGAVELSPRFARAWVLLGEPLARSGRGAEEEAVLRAAVAAECESAIVLARLAEIELGRGDVAAADARLARAAELLPEWPQVWRLWAEVALRQGSEELAAERRRRAAAPRP
jgi:arylsulfatase A-like enzyme/Tfp pilus assembly protein PilF